MTKTNTRLLIFSVTMGGIVLSKILTPAQSLRSPAASGAIQFGTSISTSLHEMDDYRKRTSSNFDIRPVIKLENGLRISSSLSFTKDLENERELTLNDSYLAFSKGISFDNGMNLGTSVAIGLPISEYSRYESTLESSIKITPNLNYSYKKFNAGLGLSFTQNKHASEVSASGSSNSQTIYTTFGDVGLSFSDQISVSASASYTKSYTYQKNERDSYSIEQSLSYSPNAAFGLSIGHAIGGNVLSVNGRDSNIEIFNSDASSVFMSVRYIYK